MDEIKTALESLIALEPNTRFIANLEVEVVPVEAEEALRSDFNPTWN